MSVKLTTDIAARGSLHLRTAHDTAHSLGQATWTGAWNPTCRAAWSPTREATQHSTHTTIEALCENST